MEPKVTQTEAGQPVEIRSKFGEKRTVKVDRVWLVEIDGVEIGHVRYRMLTRERRGKGMRYVYARWRSPGWERREVGSHYWFESPSKKSAIQSLLWDAR